MKNVMKAPTTDTEERSAAARSSSTERVTRWRKRRRSGVLFVADLQVRAQDVRVLQLLRELPAGDPAGIGRQQFTAALGRVLDQFATHCGLISGQATGDADDGR